MYQKLFTSNDWKLTDKFSLISINSLSHFSVPQTKAHVSYMGHPGFSIIWNVIAEEIALITFAYIMSWTTMFKNMLFIKNMYLKKHCDQYFKNKQTWFQFNLHVHFGFDSWR